MKITLNFKFSISILCGGKAKRFGKNKAFYRVNGKPLIQLIYDKFKSFSNDVFLQGAENELANEIKTYPDIIKAKGPLGGIYSSLLNAKYKKLFVIACDTPFVDERILKELLKYKKYDIVVPQWTNGYYEPLCALYSKNLIPTIKAQIDKNILKITKVYEFANVRSVNIDTLIESGKLRKDCFKNINFPEDLKSSAL